MFPPHHPSTDEDKLPSSRSPAVDLFTPRQCQLSRRFLFAARHKHPVVRPTRRGWFGVKLFDHMATAVLYEHSSRRTCPLKRLDTESEWWDILQLLLTSGTRVCTLYQFTWHVKRFIYVYATNPRHYATYDNDFFWLCSSWRDCEINMEGLTVFVGIV